MTKKIKVAISFPIVSYYHLRFLEKLGQVSHLDITCFHGPARKGSSLRSVGSHLPVKSVWMKNYFWPFRGDRILWQSPIKKLLQGPYDIIVCHEAIQNLAIWVFWLLRKIYKKRLIFYGYGYRPQNLPRYLWILRNCIRKFILTFSDAIIVYTDRGRAECIKAGINSEKIFVINNTLDTEYLISLEQDIKSEELDIFKQLFNLSERPVLLYVGRLIPVKRLDILLKAFQQLQETRLRPVLLIIGEGPGFQSLSDKAKDLKDIHFLGPIYDERELAKIFLISDLLVIPGRVGLTCVHGFCYGVPIITTAHNVEQSPEIDYIKHEENGYMVDRPRADLHATAITYLLSNPDKLKAMRAKARQTARSLTMTYMVSQFVNAIRYAVSGKS